MKHAYARGGLAALLVLFCFASVAQAEDGYDLWLRYQPVENAWLGKYRAGANALVTAGTSPTAIAARDELVRGLSGLLGRKIPVEDTLRANGAVLFGTPANSPSIAGLHLRFASLGSDGYLIQSARCARPQGRPSSPRTAMSACCMARSVSCARSRHASRWTRLDIASAPQIKHRIIDHWDNLNRTIERGYAGFSIWNWQKLPDYLDPRYTDYARADASIGINGAVLNNVNAQAAMLTPELISRRWRRSPMCSGLMASKSISPRASAAPIELGGLEDRRSARSRGESLVARPRPTRSIAAIPDFGGFLVKANSEGQPGPQDYHRTHADGANMLADALAPHHGIVMWRAFVYSDENNPDDRVKQAYNEFVPLDGKFRDNVIVQVKNGPLDFQPREPFSPLFGAMPKTHLGCSKCRSPRNIWASRRTSSISGPLCEEVLESDTYAKARARRSPK